MIEAAGAIAGLMASVFLFTGLIIFGRRKQGYSHIRYTISELGEVGTRDQHRVAWAWFLPIGLLVMLFAWGVRGEFAEFRNGSHAILLFGLTGVAYVTAALAPCSAGAPLIGGVRTAVHNLGAVLGYGGAGAGLIILSEGMPDSPAWSAWSEPTRMAGLASFATLGLIAILFPIRGLVQRIGEAAIFGWMAAVSIQILIS